MLIDMLDKVLDVCAVILLSVLTLMAVSLFGALVGVVVKTAIGG